MAGLGRGNGGRGGVGGQNDRDKGKGGSSRDAFASQGFGGRDINGGFGMDTSIGLGGNDRDSGRDGGLSFGGVGIDGAGNAYDDNRAGGDSLLSGGRSVVDALADFLTPDLDLKAPTGEDPGAIGTALGAVPGMGLGMGLAKLAQDLTGIRGNNRGPDPNDNRDSRTLLTAPAPTAEPTVAEEPTTTPPVVDPGDPDNVGMRGRRRRQSTLLGGSVGQSLLSPL